MLRSVTAKQEA